VANFLKALPHGSVDRDEGRENIRRIEKPTSSARIGYGDVFLPSPQHLRETNCRAGFPPSLHATPYRPGTIADVDLTKKRRGPQ